MNVFVENFRITGWMTDSLKLVLGSHAIAYRGVCVTNNMKGMEGKFQFKYILDLKI